MSRFKDAVLQDIVTTFTNIEEFGEVRNINGIFVACVIDDHLADEMSTRDGMVGILPLSRTVYVKKSDIDTPVQGEIFVIDGEKFTVSTVRDDIGLLQIEVERYGN